MGGGQPVAKARGLVSDGGAGLFERAEATAETIRAAFSGCAPEAGVVLGSGLGAFAEDLADVRYLPYSDIPGFPVSTVAGHKGRLAYGTVGGRRVLVLQGRFHLYEGYTLQDVTFPLRVLARLGIRCAVLTNAAGGIGRELRAGDLMVIRDHLNLMGQSPLEGPNDERFGPRFPDMTHCYSAALREVVRAAGAQEGLALPEGVYAALRGPSYETPAEIHMLRTLGADAVGMSTAPEAIVLRHMGIPCAAISGIANKAAGIDPAHVLTHEEVVEAMRQVAERFCAVLARAVPLLIERAAAGA